MIKDGENYQWWQPSPIGEPPCRPPPLRPPRPAGPSASACGSRKSLIFFVFTAAGLVKLLTPIPQLAAMMPWTGEHSEAFVRTIGLIDLAGGNRHPAAGADAHPATTDGAGSARLHGVAGVRYHVSCFARRGCRYAAQCRPARARRLRVVGHAARRRSRHGNSDRQGAAAMHSLNGWSRRGLLAGATILTAGGPAAAKDDRLVDGVVILIDSNEPYVMGHAISYSGNLAKTLRRQGREIVDRGRRQRQGHRSVSRGQDHAYRAARDTASVAAKSSPTACAHRQKRSRKPRNRSRSPLISGASLVPFGIGRVVDLQLKGWAYIHA